jgi:hypothetical protein
MILRKYQRKGHDAQTHNLAVQHPNPSLPEKDGAEMFIYPYPRRHIPVEMPTHKHRSLFELPS